MSGFRPPPWIRRPLSIRQGWIRLNSTCPKDWRLSQWLGFSEGAFCALPEKSGGKLIP
jgi:hypothetical protein